MIPITKDLLERLIGYAGELINCLDYAELPYYDVEAAISEATALLSQHNHETDKNEGE